MLRCELFFVSTNFISNFFSKKSKRAPLYFFSDFFSSSIVFFTQQI